MLRLKHLLVEGVQRVQRNLLPPLPDWSVKNTVVHAEQDRTEPRHSTATGKVESNSPLPCQTLLLVLSRRNPLGLDINAVYFRQIFHKIRFQKWKGPVTKPAASPLFQDCKIVEQGTPRLLTENKNSVASQIFPFVDPQRKPIAGIHASGDVAQGL